MGEERPGAERESLQESLQRSEARRAELEQIINRSPVAAVVWPSHPGAVHPVDYVSESIRQFGYTPEEFYTRRINFRDIVHPDDRERIAEEVARHKRDDLREYSQEYRILSKDGGVRWIHDRTWVARTDAEGKPTHYHGVILDITERKEMEASLRRAERMAAVGTLASGVAHQFNDMHGAIMGYLEAVLESGAISRDVKENLETIHKTTERAVGVTRNLLAFAEKDEPLKRHSLLSSLVDSTLRIVLRDFQADGIEVGVHHHEVTALWVDPTQIAQVVMNLLVNTQHAMFGRNVRKLDIETGRKESRAFIRVSDTGCGIAAPRLADIFVPLYSTKAGAAPGRSARPDAKGIGLGLSVCQRILRNHGGQIEVESTPDVGTTVTVWLPLARGKEAVRRQEDTPVRTVPGARVLVLEDEDVMQTLTAGVLRRQGYSVKVCDDGEEALRLLAEAAFDLVVVDLQMRRTNGAAFLRKLAELAPSRRPVGLALTGRATRATARDHVALGVFDTVQKPWQARDLCEKVYAAIASRKGAP